MKEYDDLTDVLRAVQRQWQADYTHWVSFVVDVYKLQPIVERWRVDLGIDLPAWKRQDRKHRGLANAVAMAGPVIGAPHLRQVMLMATPAVANMPAGTPWHRQQWKTSLPTFSEYIMVHEPRLRGDYAWTWRLQQQFEVGLQRHFTALVHKGDASQIKYHTEHAVRFHPLFGGVRRQLIRLIKSACKLWDAKYNPRPKSKPGPGSSANTQAAEDQRKPKGRPWPGQDPDTLPAMIGFKAAKVAKPTGHSVFAPREPPACAVANRPSPRADSPARNTTRSAAGPAP